MKVVASDARQLQGALPRTRARRGNGMVLEHVASGHGPLTAGQARERSAIQNLPAKLTCAGAHVDQPIRVADHVDFVFDDEQRIACGLEAIQGAQQRLRVGWMQPRGRFIEHVHDAEQIRADLGRQPKSLQFTRRERGRTPLQAQVAEAEIEQHAQPRAHVFGDAACHDHPLRVRAFQLCQ